MINTHGHKLIPIEDLKPYPRNVKIHSPEQIEALKKQIQNPKIGWLYPIVLDDDNTIIGGHARLEVAKQLGMKKVPYILLKDMSEVEKKLFLIVDNRLNESPWNIENVQILIAEIPRIELMAYNLDLEDIAPKLILDETDEIPEPPKIPKSKLGDKYSLGVHTLVCGDSTKEALPRDPAMIYTDPPYGLGGYAGRSGKFKPIEGDDKDVRALYEATLIRCEKCQERYVWGTWDCLKFMPKPRDVIVWAKQNFGMGRGYRGQYEICLYYGEFAGSDSDLWRVDKDNVADYNHPTQKPVELARRALRNSTKTGDLVVDMFAGSGSTLIACEQLERVCYSIELDPGYIDVIIERWENYTSKKAKLVT